MEGSVVTIAVDNAVPESNISVTFGVETRKAGSDIEVFACDFGDREAGADVGFESGIGNPVTEAGLQAASNIKNTPLIRFINPLVNNCEIALK